MGVSCLKLVIAIIHERDKGRVSDALLQAGHQFTVVASTGGFLRDGNTTLLIGAEKAKLDEVLGVLRDCCKTREQYVTQPALDVLSAGGGMMNPIKVSVGGAIIFVVNVEQFERV